MSSNDETVVARPHKPDWLKVKLHDDPRYAEVAAVVRRHDLHTICASGRCPNISTCWSRGTATFMIGGDTCTRACRFCATKSAARPAPLDAGEPLKVARSVALMGLRHAVITSVDRDDLADGGAGHWAETVRAIRRLNPEATVELLIPDFSGDFDLLEVVLAAGADIVGHNVETVARLTPVVRDRRASYETSLEVLRRIAAFGVERGDTALAKSALMVGLGEERDEVLRTLDDLAAAGVRRMTIGQYLQPTARHYPVAEYVHPELFEAYKAAAVERGIVYTESGPLVRSSYMADRLAPAGRKVSRPLAAVAVETEGGR